MVPAGIEKDNYYGSCDLMLLTGGPTGPSGPSLPGAPLGPCVNEPHRKIFQSVKLIFYFGICNCKSKLLCT